MMNMVSTDAIAPSSGKDPAQQNFVNLEHAI